MEYYNQLKRGLISFDLLNNIKIYGNLVSTFMIPLLILTKFLGFIKKYKNCMEIIIN